MRCENCNYYKNTSYEYDEYDCSLGIEFSENKKGVCGCKYNNRTLKKLDKQNWDADFEKVEERKIMTDIERKLLINLLKEYRKDSNFLKKYSFNELQNITQLCQILLADRLCHDWNGWLSDWDIVSVHNLLSVASYYQGYNQAKNETESPYKVID